jgi:hypothetical protein
VGSVNVVSEKTREIVMQYSELYGNIERVAEKITPPRNRSQKQQKKMDDPCELRQTAGYRFAYATRITNDAWIINLRATLA